MRDKPRDRAIRAALTLLHQPGADGASGAWRTVGELGRIGVQLRSAVDEAMTGIETFGTLATLGARPGGGAEPWTAAATELAERLEEAAAWWTVGSDFSWPAWDESSSAALGELLCELDALAAALLTAAGSDAPPPPASPLFPPGAEPAPGAQAGAPRSVGAAEAELADVIELDAHRRSGRRRGHGYGGRLVPSIGLAAAAVVGVLGGITVAASRVSPAEVPRRAIVSEPVPYTLHDADPTASAATGGGAGDTLGPAAQGGGTAGSAEASEKPMAPASAPSAATVSAPGSAPVPQQGSKTPQPRDAGPPPSIPATLPGPQLDGMVTGIRTQAEQVQVQQLRELAERMQAALGLTTGFRTP
jgi:hypothetical protein